MLKRLGGSTKRRWVGQHITGGGTLHGIFRDFPTIYEVQALLVEKAIALSQGNKSIAAKMLGLSRPTLLKRLEEAAEKHRGSNRHSVRQICQEEQ